MKNKLTLLLTLALSLCSSMLYAQLAEDVVDDTTTDPVIVDTDTDAVSTVNYENNPVYGNSSSRGVSVFSVPGQATTGSSSVNRFAIYSTGLNRLILSDPVYSRNPLAYSRQLPVSGVGSVKAMPYQLLTKIRTQMPSVRASDMTKLQLAGFKDLAGVSIYRNESDSIEDMFRESSLVIPRRSISNPLYKMILQNNASKLSSKKKVLLLGKRGGRLSFQRNSMKRSLVNRYSRVTGVSKLNSLLNTSAVLGGK